MKKIKILGIFAFLVVALSLTSVYAASASISANKTTAYVGDSVKVTVSVKAAAWNLGVSGSASGSIIGYNSDKDMYIAKECNHK